MRPSSFLKRASLFGALLALGSLVARADDGSFTGSLNVSPVASTVPANGDENPYGVAYGFYYG